MCILSAVEVRVIRNEYLYSYALSYARVHHECITQRIERVVVLLDRILLFVMVGLLLRIGVRLKLAYKVHAVYV